MDWNDVFKDIKQAYKINPSMFNKDSIDAFKDNINSAEQEEKKFFKISNIFDNLFALDIKFTDNEYKAINKILSKHGLVVEEEYKKATREELGEKYNVSRDDYTVLCTNDLVLHILKERYRDCNLIEYAKQGEKLRYQILECRSNNATDRFFNSFSIEKLCYDPLHPITFKTLLNRLDKVLSMDYMVVQDKEQMWDEADEFRHEKWKRRKAAKRKKKRG